MKRLFSLEPEYDKRVYGLDVFRAAAILLVVMSHGSFIINFFAPGFPYIRFIDGVELFFVLSGFLIGSILLKKLSSVDKISLNTLMWFWKRRWLRTLPNYYLILGLNFLLVYFGIIKGDIEHATWKFLLFIHNFSGPFTDFFWESWSLSIEEWFYIIFPLALFMLLMINRSTRYLKSLSLFAVICFILFPLFYRFAISDIVVDKFWHDVTFRKVVLTRLDSIMYGVLMAWIKFYYPAFFHRTRSISFLTGILIIYLVITPVYDPNGQFAKTIYFSAIGAGASLLLPLADSVKKFRTRFGRYVTHISLISYSMYLLNLAPVAQVIENNLMPSGQQQAMMLYFVYWTVVITASTLLYKYFEKPIMDLRR